MSRVISSLSSRDSDDIRQVSLIECAVSLIERLPWQLWSVSHRETVLPTYFTYVIGVPRNGGFQRCSITSGKCHMSRVIWGVSSRDSDVIRQVSLIERLRCHTSSVSHRETPMSYDIFHQKCYIPEILRIERLTFLGIPWYKFKLRFWFHLNLYREIGVSGCGGFRGCMGWLRVVGSLEITVIFCKRAL